MGIFSGNLLIHYSTYLLCVGTWRGKNKRTNGLKLCPNGVKVNVNQHLFMLWKRSGVPWCERSTWPIIFSFWHFFVPVVRSWSLPENCTPVRSCQPVLLVFVNISFTPTLCAIIRSIGKHNRWNRLLFLLRKMSTKLIKIRQKKNLII